MSDEQSDEERPRWKDVKTSTGTDGTWRVRYVFQSDGWCDFKAWEQTGTDGYDNDPDQRPLFGLGDATTTDCETIEPSVSGYVKFDGCMQIDISQHCCGARHAAELAALIPQLHALCLELPGVMRDCADYTEDGKVKQ